MTINYLYTRITSPPLTSSVIQKVFPRAAVTAYHSVVPSPFMLSPNHTPAITVPASDSARESPGLSRRCPLSIECCVDALDASCVVSGTPILSSPDALFCCDLSTHCALSLGEIDPAILTDTLHPSFAVFRLHSRQLSRQTILSTHYTSIYPLASLVLTDHRDIFFAEQ